MTQKERDELQKYLDERIFGTRRQKRSIYANNQLKKGQKDFLYRIVKDVSGFKPQQGQYSNALDIAIIKVACCLRQIHFHGMRPNPKNSRNIVPRDKMPFLIKQVFWLICYKALQAGLKQKDVYDELGKYNIYVSHNFFSSLEQTPDYFLRCEKYSQPENPCKYKGQKKDELAEAIKNLVYQAGAHSCFVDVFGGSGSASAAVCRKRKVKYVYNEKNSRVCNYMKQISGKKYMEVIEILEKMQEDLRMPDLSLKSKLGFSFQAQLSDYISSKKESSWKDVIKEEEEIQEFGDMSYNFNDISIRDVLDKLNKKLQAERRRLNNKDDVQNIIVNAITQISAILSSTNISQDFHAHVDELNDLCKECIILTDDYPYKVRMCPKPKGFSFEEFTYEDYIKWVVRYKALGYYAYFKNNNLFQKLRDNHVMRAAGEIFLKYISIRGTEVSTAILDYVKRHYLDDEKNELRNFINEDFADKVKEFHDALSGTIIEDKDFRDIIQDYSDKNTLFYSDSPYISTSDYKDEEGGVSGFSVTDMKELIEGLMNCNKDNKFIFSMRGVKSGEEVSASGKRQPEIVNGNREICQYVYKEFMSYKKSLYVLVIYEKGKDLWNDLIKNSKVVEVMITNYEIVSFEVEGRTKNKRYKCETFTFDEYLKLIKANMVGYQKSWGL